MDIKVGDKIRFEVYLGLSQHLQNRSYEQLQIPAAQ
jgi:hypothetical protein